VLFKYQMQSCRQHKAVAMLGRLPVKCRAMAPTLLLETCSQNFTGPTHGPQSRLPICFSPLTNFSRTQHRCTLDSLFRSRGGHRSLPPLRFPKMAPLEDLTRVLAELAARLSRPPAGGGNASYGDALSASISSLAATLNPSGGRGGASSGTRVLDAALSLMCFDPLEARRHPRRVPSSIVPAVHFS
jgi:hypothetical protein